MNDKFPLRDYPLKAASLYVSALSFILENTIIKHYSSKISELRIKLEDNNKKLARIKCVLNKTKLTCVCLAAFGSCFRMYKNSHDIINEEVSEDMLYYSLELLSNTTGLILFFNYLIDTILSKYEEKNSSLNKESDSYVEERNMLKNKLRHFQKRSTVVIPILIINELNKKHSRVV